MSKRACYWAVCLCFIATWCLRSASSAEPTAAEKKESLRVASVSIFPEKWNKAANAEKIQRLVRAAAAEGAQLVITPEGVLEGYVVNIVNNEPDSQKKAELTAKFKQTAEPINGPFARRFAALADELNIYLILGMLEADGEKTYNASVLFGPDGKLVGKYHKTHFQQGYDVNPPGYTPGDSYPVFNVGGLKVGMMICFDRQLPEPARNLTLNGADLIACPSYGAHGAWNTRLMQVRAYENQVSVIFTHPEESLIIDRNGELLKEGAKDSYVIQDISLAKPKKIREAVTRRRPETYRDLSGPSR